MKTAYIVLNGNLSKKINTFKPQKNDLIICADGGASLAQKNDVLPHIIIGDFDSIPPKTKQFFKKKNVQFISYPREKDFTDAELAIEYAMKHTVTKIVVFGLFGDRIDHMLSNIYHLSTFAKKISCSFIEKNLEIHFVHAKLTLKGVKGDELSLIPLRNDAVGIQTQGLYYPLNNESLPFGSTRGISNVFEGSKVTISLKKGVLLAIHRKLS